MNATMSFRFLTACLVLASTLVTCTAWAYEPINFNREIRPILSDKCFFCHGPDAKNRQADLRLDVESAAKQSVIVVGKPDESELIRRVFAEDVADRMPPPDSKLALTSAEKEKLKAWITQGAKWTEHWSFTPPVAAEPPEDKTGWAQGPIDAFVLERMHAAGLEPSPEADRVTLIRRLTLDLTGLPPTPEEVDAFLADKSPSAYEKVVDRLLESQQYGERMAWEWLDAARYSDTDGFQGDPTRTMWPWRDWLIRALNANMPFDQFTIEMLAGDLLPDPTAAQVIATGFNRNNMYNGEGGRIAEETRVENVFDRAETTSTVWLGLTLTCCRCHDHKYDPISQKEYYQFYAFFNNISETGQGRGNGKAPPVVNFLPSDTQEEIELLDQQIAALTKQLSAPDSQLDSQQETWESELREKLAGASASPVTLGPWQVLGPLPFETGDAAALFDHEFGPEKEVDLEQKYLDGKHSWREEKDLKDGQIHPLPETVGATYLYRTLDAPSARNVEISLGSDDGIRVWLNGKSLLSKNVARAAAADQESLRLQLKPGQNKLLLKIVNTGGIGGFYFQKKSETLGGLPPEVAEALLIEPAKRNGQQKSTLRDHFRAGHSPEWKKQSGERTKLQAQRDKLAKTSVPVMVMDDLPEKSRRVTKILDRGIYDKPLDEVVTEGTPGFLPPLPADVRRDRMAVARWLVSPDNPLTARVTVNRYWQTFFGRGIVASTEDFGSQGSRPTHPQLLDWLAVQFRQDWDVKALHKLIVMSATYRQSSAITPQAAEFDPENIWLARSPRYRLPSWMLRDQALAASGLIVGQVGGPSVRPYQPEGIWAEATFGKIRYQQDSGDALYRRSLYIFWRRIVGPTMFFDSAKRQTCEVKPTRTNTPLHALTTLNETTFVEAARTLAQRVMQADLKTPAERIHRAFRLVTARQPEPSEEALLVRRWEALQKGFAANPEEAEQLLSVGESPRDEKLPAADHAAYTVVCSLLLNLDETLSKE